MGVNIYNTRRTNYHKCNYWLRDEKGTNDNETLILNTKPDGVFYAKQVDTKVHDETTFNGVWQISSEKIHIETSDDVNKLRRDDKVLFRGVLYVVDYISQRMINKRSEFDNSSNNITSIYLRK